MAKKVMLITGSSGRIGKLCVHHFADEYQVVGFDREKVEHAKDMDHFTMDVASPASVQEALAEVRKRYGNQIDTVLHLAAYYSFEGGKPELYEKVTVQGTQHVLESLQSFEVGQFIFSSTVLVYAPCQLGQKMNEEWPLNPKWDYPKSKVRTEKVIFEKHGKIPAVILRIAGCYDDQCHSIPIAHNAQRIYEQQWEAHLYPGDQERGNPFLHMNDLIVAYQQVIKNRDKLPQEVILNIGEDKTASYKLLQDRISEILNNEEFQIYRIPKWMAKVGAEVQSHLPFISDNFIQPWMIDVADDHYALDITRAKQMIQWEPKHYVIDDLPTMLAQLKTDPLAWYNTNQLTPPSWLIKKVEEAKNPTAGAKK